MTAFFVHNFILVYFIYGLSFFSMGLAVFLELTHSSELDFSRALRPLAAFGLIHGSHEWFEMFLLIYKHPGEEAIGQWVYTVRLVLLASSFLMLLTFGALLIQGIFTRKAILVSSLVPCVIWAAGLVWVLNMDMPLTDRQIAGDVYTRYSLAVPGAILTGLGLWIQRKRFIKEGMRWLGTDVTLAAFAFVFYGIIGQIFASPSTIFLAPYLNADVFLQWFGFPIQVFRALMAILAAIFIIRSLRSLEVSRSRNLEMLRQAQLAEHKMSEELRSELLHRTVDAQETERQRIARELHDETGQTLTALGMGLRGLSENIQENPSRAIEQAHQLEGLTTAGIAELQRLVTDLHPPQLDDLGLSAALRWFVGEVSNSTGLNISVISSPQTLNLPLKLRIILFRIAQEAVTNIVRHSLATRSSIQLKRTTQEVQMTIEDNGRGFVFDREKIIKQGQGRTSWGLVGMIERAALVGGTCNISSRLGQGTTIEVRLPIVEEEK